MFFEVEAPRVQVCGFSGTNDNRQLLPFSVKPEHPEDTATQGTDGKMVDVLATPGKCRFLRLADAADAAPLRLRLGSASGDAAATNGQCSGGMEGLLLQDAALEGSTSGQVNGASDAGALSRAASAGAYHGKRLLDLVVLLGVHALIDAGAPWPHCTKANSLHLARAHRPLGSVPMSAAPAQAAPGS